MTFQPLSVVTARITAELARDRAERMDRATANLQEFVDEQKARLRRLEDANARKDVR